MIFSILNYSWAEDEGFTWSTGNDHGVGLGGRMKISDAWGKKVLLIQAALRNQSAHPICIPVHLPNMGIQAVGLKYVIPDPKLDLDPFEEKRDYTLIYPTVCRDDPFIEPAGLSVHFIQIEPGGVTVFSPIIADLSGMPVLTNLESVIQLATQAPNPVNALYQVKEVNGKGFVWQHSNELDLGMFPKGKWKISVKLEPEHQKAEQAGADQPATRSESKSGDVEKPKPDSEPAPR